MDAQPIVFSNSRDSRRNAVRPLTPPSGRAPAWIVVVSGILAGACSLLPETRASAVEVLEAAAPSTPEASAVALFSIVLPDGWQMHRLDQTAPRAVRFTFSSPNNDLLYLFCEVRFVDVDERDRLLSEALECPDRAFLDEAEPDTRYCDRSRFILWSTKKSSEKIVEVQATLFDEHVHRFKFFIPRSEFADFQPKLVKVVHTIRLAGTPPTFNGRSPVWPEPPSQEEIDRLFEKSRASGWFKWALLTVTILLVGGLFTAERIIRMRSYKEQVADATRQQEARRKTLPPGREEIRSSTESYLRDVAACRRAKKETPTEDEDG